MQAVKKSNDRPILMKGEKRYVLIYHLETGGTVVMEQLTADEVRKTVARWQLQPHEYGVVDGKLMKSFVAPFNLVSLK